MSVQRTQTASGRVRYRARVKSHGREVGTRVFDRRADAVAWEQDQCRRIRTGDWVDPKRGRVSLAFVAESWLETRRTMKRRTRETDELSWRRYVAPKLGTRTIGTLTTAEVAEWLAQLMGDGRSAATARRGLATLRAILDHAVADNRLARNVARLAKAPRGGSKREGLGLSQEELHALAAACRDELGEIVLVLGYSGLRWGELAGLQVGDRVAVPGPGLRVQRALLTGRGGHVYVDSLKSHRARTVPLAGPAIEIISRRSDSRPATDWIFTSAAGKVLREGNWKRSVDWNRARTSIGRPTLRVHDLRHTTASIWLAAGADPKVVQRILGHASAAMTMDLYGHLIDTNLWTNARLLGGIPGAFPESESNESEEGSG